MLDEELPRYARGPRAAIYELVVSVAVGQVDDVEVIAPALLLWRLPDPHAKADHLFPPQARPPEMRDDGDTVEENQPS